MTGAMTSYPVNSSGAALLNLTLGTDGAIWFSSGSASSSEVGKVTTGIADPQVITAVGTDTTADVTQAVLAAQYAVRPGEQPDLPVPADASCGNVTYTTRPSPGAVTAPDGADAAVSAFRDSLNGTYPDPARDTGKGCIDLAGSDQGPRPVGPTGDRPTFEYYTFTLDIIDWASPSLDASPI